MDVRLCGEVRKCVPAFSRALSRKQMERSRMSDVPELPEVETTVRGLAPFLEGKRLVAVKIGRAHVCSPVTTAQLVCRLQLDTKINDVDRAIQSALDMIVKHR